MEFISHPLIAPNKVERRKYQVNMANGCLRMSSLVVLPTGLGKTAIALMVAAEVLSNGQKVLMLAPTKPLVEQHHRSFSSMLSIEGIGIMTGHMAPDTRAKVVLENEFIVSTPQTVENDLENGRYDLSGFGLVIYDEAHRGIGNYSYVTIARHAVGILSLGLTASPGSDLKKIEEVCNNLSLSRIDIRSDEDADVAPYVHDTYVNKIEVNMPDDLAEISRLLRSLLNRYFDELGMLRLTNPGWPVSMSHLLAIGDTLRKRMQQGERSTFVFRGLSVQSICIKILHAINLVETQGTSSLRIYLKKLNDEAEGNPRNKGANELVSNKEYIQAWRMASTTSVEHPKVSKVMSLVSQKINQDDRSKVLVFTQYRDTCDMLVEKISLIPDARVGRLIGQSNGGLKQKEQIEMLKRFISGDFNVVVSTSVGEEGLDVTNTDAVIFYEPVPSEIRTIQRRGRTGRRNDGEVFVLVTKGTMDEVFANSSETKEDLMRQRLRKLSDNLSRIGRIGTNFDQTNLK